jgi:hypothetical protein
LRERVRVRTHPPLTPSIKGRGSKELVGLQPETGQLFKRGFSEFYCNLLDIKRKIF